MRISKWWNMHQGRREFASLNSISLPSACSVMMQDVPPDLLNFEDVEELDPDVRLHTKEEDKR